MKIDSSFIYYIKVSVLKIRRKKTRFENKTEKTELEDQTSDLNTFGFLMKIHSRIYYIQKNTELKIRQKKNT